MPFSAWYNDPPAEITHNVGADEADIPGAALTRPQWFDDGGPTPAPAEPINGTEHAGVVAEMGSNLTGPGGIDFAALWYTTNFDIQSHWLWDDIYTDSLGRSVAMIPIVEDDGYAWRLARQSAIAYEWEAANPGKFVVGFEWEGDDGTSQLGSHTDRRLSLNFTGWDGTLEDFTAGEGEFYRRQTIPIVPPGDELPQPRIDLRIADIDVGIPPAFPSYTYTGAGVTTSLTSWQWSTLGVEAAGVPFGSLHDVEYATISIPDSDFDAHAVPLVNQSAAYRHTRGLVVMGIPSFDGVFDTTSRLAVSASANSVILTSTYQPPRWRVNYFTAEVEPVIRRVYPRDDSRAGGAYRIYPPSKAMQSGNRTVGGYL